MEHIRQYDWCTFQPDTPFFVTESELENCVTEKILRNKFSNPLISSDSEEEGKAPKIDWNLIFKKRNNEQKFHRIFVPGLRPPPAYARLSALSSHQHHLGLRLLCAQHPHILEDEFVPKPNRFDMQAFEALKEVLEKEQKEYIDWAKSLWTNGQCIRALRPKPQIEAVYEAEFKVRAKQMKNYPKVFEMVAQIPIEPSGEHEMVMEKELIGVNLSDLLNVQRPGNIRSRVSVMRPSAVPEPCDQHPVRFVLPHEKTVSVLPVTEVYRSLAEYAADHGALFVASEGALRCLVERRAWALPVAVYNVPQSGPGIEDANVIVLGSEFMNKQENVLRRTFRALRHLLEVALVPASELGKRPQAPEEIAPQSTQTHDLAWPDDSSDDEDNLFIDFDEASASRSTKDSDTLSKESGDVQTEMEIDKNNAPQKETKNTTNINSNRSISEGFGVYKCTCQDTVFERPPPRSFRKWRFRNKSTFEDYDVIVHCAHKFKGPSGEMLLEPIPEYQADLGASKQSEDRIASLALSLALRDDNTSVLNVRLDAPSGDIITTEEYTREQFHQLQEHGPRLAGTVHAALTQLRGLVPGHYIMQHEPNHGNNALLYAPRNTGKGQQLKLEFDSMQPAEADEAKTVRTPPRLTPALLPWHKFRKILPCTFTHYPNQLAKPKKQPPRKKTPPRALKTKEEKRGVQKKWPKKKGGRKKPE